MAPISDLLFVRADTQYSAAYLAENNSTSILATTGAWCFISLLVVSLRVYVRAFMVKFFGWDDVAILVTSVLGLGVWVCFVGQAQYGLGRHLEAISTSDEQMALLWQFPLTVFLLFGNGLAKISVALLLLRITGGVVYRKTFYTIIGVVIVYTLVTTGAFFGACDDISANWKLDTAADAKCLAYDVRVGLIVGYSVFSMLTEAILAVLPIPIIVKLHLNIRTKMAICLVLSLGFATVGCGMVKTYYYSKLSLTPDYLFRDRSRTWAALELYTGIVVASLPTLRPLLTAGRSKGRTTTVYAVYDQTTSHDQPGIILSPTRLKPISECQESKISFEEGSEAGNISPRPDSMDSHIRTSVSSFGMSRINTTTLSLDSVANPTPVALSRPPKKLKLQTRNPSFSHINADRNANFENTTSCTRSQSIAPGSASSPEWFNARTTPALTLGGSPGSHLFPSDTLIRHVTPPVSPSRPLFSPRSFSHRRAQSVVSNGTSKSIDSGIVVTKRVITVTESVPVGPSSWMSPVPLSSLVGPCQSPWFEEPPLPAPKRSLQRTIEKIFRKRHLSLHGVSGEPALEEGDSIGMGGMAPPTQSGYEGVNLDWDALDAPMDYGSSLAKVTSEVHPLSESGSTGELLVHEVRDK